MPLFFAAMGEFAYLVAALASLVWQKKKSDLLQGLGEGVSARHGAAGASDRSRGFVGEINWGTCRLSRCLCWSLSGEQATLKMELFA